MPEKLTKESEKKEVRIKRQEEMITKLTKRLEERPAQSFTESLKSKHEEKMFV